MRSGVLVTRFLAALATVIAFTVTGRPAQARPIGAAGCAPAVTRSSSPFNRLVAAQNDFGFHLLRSLLGGSTNVFLSPTSASLALDMAYDGARGGTASAMARTLGLTGMTPAETGREAAAYLHRLQSGGEGLTVADSLWARQGIRFRQAFLGHAGHYYGATTHTLDFNAPVAPASINRWASCATNGKIPTIINRIPPRVILYLINAVYFHGDWMHPFNLADTHKRAFTTAAGARTQVPMMSQIASFPYAHGSNFQAVRLPYKAGRFSMVVVEPKGLSFRTFSRQISAAQWRHWTSQMRPTTGALTLPRFSLHDDHILNGPLSSLGMGDAFTSQADLSGICVQRCRLSEVRQKTYLGLNERGTVAAAVTSVSVEPTFVQTPRFTMLVDHPFFLAIQDGTTGAVLFVGAVTNP